MRIRIFIIVVLSIIGLFLLLNKNEKPADSTSKTTTEAVFEKTKWGEKKGKDYPYREQMLNDVVYNDTIRSLNKDELVELLGEPDRENEGHLYYLISQRRLGAWPLHTRSMVVKLTDDNSIDWIKIHE